MSEVEFNQPTFTRGSSGSKTIFVTQQFRHFDDDYHSVGSIGEPGAFGQAWECYLKNDPQQKRVCVKEINKARFHHIDAGARKDILNTMQNEIGMLKKVQHDNIVELFDVYEDRHRLHLVMEFLSGGELFDRIIEEDSFSEARSAVVVKQIIEALDHMHDRNIAHLDLKPDNIIFAHSGEDSPVKLIDFGMARTIPRLALLRDRVGTPQYMAPEVLMGNYSKSADVWSAGVILFCMLFGFPPFYVDEDAICIDDSGLEEKIKAGFDPTVKEGYGAWFPEDVPVSEECRSLISHMLEIDVSKRWTMKECLGSVWLRMKIDGETSKLSPLVKESLFKFNKTHKFKLAVSRIFADKLNADVLDEIKKMFHELDANGDGVISMQEFKDGIGKFAEISEEEAERIFCNIDIDDNRGLTIDELITIAGHRSLIAQDERLFEAFNELDKNQDGKISAEELTDAIDQVLGSSRSAEKKKKKIHKRMETLVIRQQSDNGEIDYEQFLKMIHPDFKEDENLADFVGRGASVDHYRGAHFNVDTQSAVPQTVLVPKASMQSYHEKKDSRDRERAMTNGTIASGAVSYTPDVDETPVPKDADRGVTFVENSHYDSDRSDNHGARGSADLSALNRINANLKVDNEQLNTKLKRSETESVQWQERYERMRSQVLEQLETAVSKLERIEGAWEERWTKKEEYYMTELKSKEENTRVKDERIAQLHLLLETKNGDIDSLKDTIHDRDTKIFELETSLQTAVDTKMQLLTQSAKEIERLSALIHRMRGAKMKGKDDKN